MSSLEERLKFARQHAGLTQRNLSELLGISLRSITNHEKNAINVSVLLAQSIAQACKVNEVWLLTGRGNIGWQSHSDHSKNAVAVIEKHKNLVESFKNPELGLSINQQLIDIQETDGYIFKNTVQSIKSFWEAAMAFKKAKLGNYSALDSETNQKEDRRKEPRPKPLKGQKKNKKSGTNDQ